MGIYAIKPRFRALLGGAADALARRGVTPDQITTAGIVASLLGGVALATGRCWRGAYKAVPVLALTRTAANALDGMVAERSGLARSAGELYNETADRLGDAAFLVGAATVPGVPPSLALGALVSAELASFVGVAAKAAGGERRYDGPMGKPDRMATIGAAGLVAGLVRRPHRPINAALLAIVVGAAATAANRYRAAYASLEHSVDTPATAG